MNRLTSKFKNIQRRQNRVRTTIRSNSDRPRLSVFISNRHISAQIIDDSKHVTLVSVSTNGKKTTGTMTERASQVGTELAKQAQTKKIKQVAFDRGPKLYHGRVKALAEAARAGGLEF